MITIKTPLLSVNSLYKGRRFLTRDGKKTKEAIAWEIKKQWKKELIKGDISVGIVFYFKDNRRHDIDNNLKALLDCMTGVVWKDDSQITELIVNKEIDRKNPRTELIIN